MKKLKVILGMLVVGVLVTAGAVLAATNNQAVERVYVLTDNSVVKTMLGVRHEFPGGFSTEVSAKLKALSSLGLIKTESVQLYHIAGKPSPTCGDGECERGENNKNCPEDCSQNPEPEPKRTCKPNKHNQIPWGVKKVNGGSGGVDVIVAILDTGVYKDHLDLKANIMDCKDTTTQIKIVEGCADGNGHGTHVAGTIAANGGSDGKGIYGVAPEAGLMVIKVCGPAGCWADDIAAGIRYAADNGANIISMSLGGDTQSSLIRDAIDYTVGEGVLVVAAAGNYHSVYNPNNIIQYPGANPNVIAVGAINSAGAVPDWSSRGINPGEQEYFIEEGEVEFGAPGVSIESIWKDGCYNTISGTSMATPHVAGLAAKLWQNNADNTRSYLHSIAKDIWIEGDDTATGFGLPIAP